MLFTGSINRYQKIVIHYDTSWDLIESNKGYLPIDEDAFEKIYGMENKKLATLAKRASDLSIYS
jgi:hypothetical protein